MKQRILIFLLCTAMILSLCGCGQSPASADTTPESTAEVTTAPTEPPVSALYSQAKTPVLDASSLSVKISDDKTILIGEETFLLETNKQLSYTGMGSSDVQISLTEDVEMQNSYDKFEEFYTDGTLYTTIYGEHDFVSSMDAESYISGLIPGALLDETLYASVSSAPDGENTLLLFNEPAAAESWAIPENAIFHTASGKALIGPDGTLLETSYTVNYTYGGSHVTRDVTAAPVLEEVSLTAPDPADYVQVDSIEALRLYDTAMLYLYAADAVTTNLTETFVSQAGACVLLTQEGVNFCGRSKNLNAKIDYSVTFQQAGQTDSYQQTELFQDMVYTVTSDGGDPQESTEVSPSAVLSYCQDYLGENLVALSYIESISVKEVGNVMYLTLGFTEEYGDLLCRYASATLFDDEELLNSTATAYALSECSGYMAVDKYTGMPSAVGIVYSASHTIDGVEYPLVLQADQSFYLASQTAYKEITGQFQPEEAPEQTPTPLFYKVTGENGQTMYLLGTIHVGDERTAYLPQEIYTALEASDALAVEVDTIAFEEAMATDPSLATQVAAAYIYTDGTTTKDHINEDTYEDAVLLMKISGNYNTATEMMKPSLWQSSISNYYLQQGYGLQSDKGVDARLLRLAKEKNMEIREVESGLFQMELLGGYSDALQELLLEDVVQSDPYEYYAAMEELFELWCNGDEDVLREAIIGDLADMSTEHQALYEEYFQAMYTDRNADMLEVAVEYLESGDTVFYAVGLAHLLAGNGLVDTLQEAGYTVELVSYN